MKTRKQNFYENRYRRTADKRAPVKPKRKVSESNYKGNWVKKMRDE